ncbi:MAG: SLC13 family permease [Planctomycetota bacterium]|jgi:di/tricarboxylate transporter|nr:SLC13 family permease [Planctomycetota bacterium]
MGIEGVLALALVAAILVLLVTEKASIDAIGIGLLVVLIGAGQILRFFDPNFDPATQLLGPQDAMTLFGNSAVLTIAALYVMGEGLSRTGAVEFFARTVLRVSEGRERRVILAVALMAGITSAFLNNTAVVLVFIPVLVDMAQKTGIAITRLLIPMAFATILGGMCTLVGTSTNLLVSEMAAEAGYEPIGMFELSPIGLPLLVISVIFIAAFARKLLPSRQSLTAMMANSNHREYVTELQIGPNSPLRDRTYKEAFADVRADLLFFARGEEMVWPPYFNETIEEGDVVMLRGTVDHLAGLQDELGLKLFNEARFDPKSMQFFELAVSPHSPMVGRTIGDLHLWRDYGAITVAVLRNNQHIRERASKQVLQPGDLLLVCGEESSQTRLRASTDFFLLTGAHNWVMLRGLARRSLLITIIIMVAFSMASLTHNNSLIPFAALSGAVAMIASGCLTARRAYRAIDWPILLFMVGTIGLGRAMENTGAAAVVAEGLVHGLQGFGPIAALGGLALLGSVMSSMVSNQAVAVLLTPIAIGAAETIAHDQGLDPSSGPGLAITRAFILAIAISASVCFATPIGHQSNLMVYGPGGYQWRDFLKAGIPVSIIAMIGIVIGVPWMTGAF